MDTFGKDNYFIELQNHGLSEEAAVRPVLAELAKEYGLGLVATNDFHYTRKKDAGSQEIKLCISTGNTMDDPGRFRFANEEFYKVIIFSKRIHIKPDNFSCLFQISL